jgi:serine/threonine-protein kinase
MSPEQVAGRPLDGRSDLYALGVTLYWLASGMFPFYGGGDAALIRRILLEPAPPLRSIAPHVPEAFASIVDNLLRKTPADRVGNGRQLAAAIEHAVPVQRERVVEYMERMRACPPPRDDHTGTVLLPQPTLEAQP